MIPAPENARLKPRIRPGALALSGMVGLLIAPPATAQDTDDQNVVTLSPFVVSTSEDDIGYYASNTLAGSRLNTRLEDIAASITVVTKQQMEDTGATSFNDVFLYEANTEGAWNYTPIEVNRGGIKDRVGGSATNGLTANNATTANRIRGLSSPDFAWNYYPSLARIPADAYNLRSIEINRGPNSLLYSLGSPAGIVNQTVGYALLGEDQSELVLRAGTNGYRGSISTNQTFADDRVAIYVAALYDEVDFTREPSYDKTERFTGSITAQPFKGTTIRALVESYDNESRLPNYILPRDGITPWLEAGRPVWNPITREVTFLDTGEVRGPYTTDLSVGGFSGDRVLDNPDSPMYVPGLGWQDYGRPAMYVHPNGEWDWRQRQASVFPAGVDREPFLNADPARRAFYDRRTTSSILPVTPSNFFSNWTAPSLTNKKLYDWEEINLNAPNFGEFEAMTYNVELEQRILDNLYISGGWFKQSLDTFEFYPLAQQQPLTVFVDTNTHHIDGTVNPNFLKPYIDDYQQDLVTAPQDREVYRAQLAYDLDLTDRDDALRWLGRHRLMGLYQNQEDYNAYNRHRIALVEPTDAPWVADDKPSNFAYAYNTSSNRRYYFLGEDARITHAPATWFGVPGYGGVSQGKIRTYDWEAGSFYDANATLETVWFDAGDGISVDHIKIESYAAALQSYFLNERIITLAGIRHDNYKARANTLAGYSREELYPAPDYRLANPDELRGNFLDWQGFNETTTTLGVVVSPLEWLKLHYNKSENFVPPSGQAFDIFENELSKPSGEGEDYGVSIHMFNNKLVARLNFFEVSQQNERAGQARTLLDRTVRMDTEIFERWAETVVRIRSGQDPSSPGFRNADHPDYRPLTNEQQSQIEALTGVPFDWPAFPIESTQTNEAEGIEFELIYNPIPNWNMKFVFSRQESGYQTIMPEYDEWIATRMPLWQAARAPDLDQVYTLDGGNTIYVGDFWNGYGFGEIPSHPNQNEWNQTVGAFYDSSVDAIVAEARQLQGAAPFGQRKWRATFITNYRFIEGVLENFGIGGAIRMEDKAVIGYYGAVNENGQYFRTDPSRPIYDTDVGVSRLDDLTHIDLWFSYDLSLFGDKVDARIQLNIRNLFGDEELLPVYANWDGSVANYRITQPREIFVTTRFRF